MAVSPGWRYIRRVRSPRFLPVLAPPAGTRTVIMLSTMAR